MNQGKPPARIFTGVPIPVKREVEGLLEEAA